MKSWNCFRDGDYTMENEQKYLRYDSLFCYFNFTGYFYFISELTLSGSCFSIDVVEIVCAMVKSLPPSVSGAAMMSMGVNILTKMLKW